MLYIEIFFELELKEKNSNDIFSLCWISLLVHLLLAMITFRLGMILGCEEKNQRTLWEMNLEQFADVDRISPNSHAFEMFGPANFWTERVIEKKSFVENKIRRKKSLLFCKFLYFFFFSWDYFWEKEIQSNFNWSEFLSWKGQKIFLRSFRFGKKLIFEPRNLDLWTCFVVIVFFNWFLQSSPNEKKLRELLSEDVGFIFLSSLQITFFDYSFMPWNIDKKNSMWKCWNSFQPKSEKFLFPFSLIWDFHVNIFWLVFETYRKTCFSI